MQRRTFAKSLIAGSMGSTVLSSMSSADPDCSETVCFELPTGEVPPTENIHSLSSAGEIPPFDAIGFTFNSTSEEVWRDPPSPVFGNRSVLFPDENQLSMKASRTSTSANHIESIGGWTYFSPNESGEYEFEIEYTVDAEVETSPIFGIRGESEESRSNSSQFNSTREFSDGGNQVSPDAAPILIAAAGIGLSVIGVLSSWTTGAAGYGIGVAVQEMEDNYAIVEEKELRSHDEKRWGSSEHEQTEKDTFVVDLEEDKNYRFLCQGGVGVVALVTQSSTADLTVDFESISYEER